MSADTGNDLLTRQELQQVLRRSSATIGRWLREKRLPPPDIAPTRESQQWRRSTLHAAGIKV